MSSVADALSVWTVFVVSGSVVFNFTVKLNTTDPDTTNTVHTESASATADKILRFGLARTRGYSANLEIDVTVGRPTIRHSLVEATGVGLNVVKEVA